ncbi:gephyrin-like molybdotransferase receptor GlpR [Mycolicibacterium sp. 050232]|uniref:divisome protein SepX/GlpR n=1 Tax=Mycolicibacterium sp. 050232 TaxID=3113982 RepID=UPI002E2A434D|nr:gephyrin-like molybdotransferase receptor GlpR [Mycolicibacterium sp. 050232]MED5813768.1 gephyrin-like molybdotransferase receptor GlpR [Mycolicibacterium sp. 050232]
MPSIPQSLLWISLVVLWLFVLVPMLISKRDSVRRTSDVALATRVLNSGRNAQRLRRGPAAGHHSDPHWQPSADHLDEDLDEDLEEEAPAEVRVHATVQRTVVVAAASVETPEPDYLDVDIVDEDSGALPVGALAEAAEEVGEPELELEFETEPEPEPVAVDEPIEESVEELAEEPVEEFDAAEAEAQTERIAVDLDEAEESADVQEAEDPEDLADDEYEYVADEAGLEPEAEDEPVDEEQGEAPVASLSATRQRRFESKKAAEISARKFRFRKRVLAVLAATLLFSAGAAFLVTPSAWWVCGTAGTLTVLYLAYLRRQTRIEEQLRRRRAQRMARSRLGVENTDDHKLDVVPARLRRPGAVVLDIDDEDPIFEHLAYASYGSMSREYDLPRASGQ